MEPNEPDQPQSFRFSRRGFLAGLGVAGLSTGVAGAPRRPAGSPTEPPSFGARESHEITLTVNGAPRKVAVETRTTLLDALRDRLDLTGAKKVCDRASCGACTVLVDDVAVNACMMLALDAVGSRIRTVEGLATATALHPVQEQFIAKDALQCGFCTPGMIMSSVACIEKHGQPTRDQIRECISGNICRCGTYTRVVDAVDAAARKEGK